MSAGVYVHVPFCAHRCDYCDFAVTTGAGPHDRHRYVGALHAELERVAAAGPAAVAAPEAATGDATWPVFGSAFVGGGTPTLLDAGELAGVLAHLRAALPLSAGAEITVEANPETVDTGFLTTLVSAGVTRLSLGAQSFAPAVLRTLGRRHEVDAVGRAVAAAREAGVPQVGLDLIYGTPGEADEDWRRTLEGAIGLGPDHVSCYALTVERGTPLGGRVRRGELADVDEDVQADRMALADQALSAAGLRRYEVSNWARHGCESVHNRTYWRGGDWLALGASAHGHWQGRRWWNARPTDRYVAEVEGGRSPVAGAEILTAEQRREERLLTGLRTAAGVARIDVEPLDTSMLRTLVRGGLLEDDPDRVRATASGLAVADGLTARLLAPGSRLPIPPAMGDTHGIRTCMQARRQDGG